MPNYQYHCLACDARFEEKRPFAQSDAPANCPACHSPQTKKLLSVVAFSVAGGHQESIPVPMSQGQGGGCCGGGSCGCGH